MNKTYIMQLFYLAVLCIIFTTAASALLAQECPVTHKTTSLHAHHHDHYHFEYGPIGVMGDHIHADNEIMFSYRYMTMYMDGSRKGTSRITGLFDAWERDYRGNYLFIVTVHKYLGIASLVIAALAAGIRLGCRQRMKKWWLACYCVLMLGLVVSIAFASHYGGMLVHG